VVARPAGGTAQSRRIDADHIKGKAILQVKIGITPARVSIYPYLKEKPAVWSGGFELFLPRALFVAIRFQALSALVLVHLESALLLEISHMELVKRTCDSPKRLSSSNWEGGPDACPQSGDG
jgi:hypothetical protein